MTHTAEPWKVWGRTVSGQKGLLIEDRHGESIALVHEGGTNDEADARRIVACVNACKGIPTDVLEHAANFGAAGIQTIESVRKQRDELLALVEKTTGVLLRPVEGKARRQHARWKALSV